MLSGTITNRYTRGLYEAAERQGVTEAVDASLRLLAETLAANPELKRFVEHPLIDPQAKLAALTKVFGDGLHPFVQRFLQMLLARGRSQYIAAVYGRFHEMFEEARGRVTVRVETARPLTDEERQALAERLGAVLGRQVTMAVEVNPALIAGCRITLKHRVIEASVQNALAQFEQQLLHTTWHAR
ncbi:hypothetical protein GCM10010885_20240 [Alicyclobacillus cellulosilyticus]|uniref:ATP synthase subunit delta n=1 Tax=Alicyclobacillus cellulosilyticus TaxID=1003997 RepID=A0A917KE97_9BACL|nr:ATP synthase F1 subunit delta [Alicyclobacillus cellulosilyticus]GGJ10958.1 hypothetical protein GCM10010885_20240 [Alicyclobacillus cellulosilyticus]